MALPQLVSKPLRLDGDAAQLIITFSHEIVSKPLRLDGDPNVRPASRATSAFLSHYGWMGTELCPGHLISSEKVSKPLRLDGDIRSGMRRSLGCEVSKPLRLDGDPSMSTSCKPVANGF